MRHGLRLLQAMLGVLALAGLSASSASAYVYWTAGSAVGRADLDGSGVTQAFVSDPGIPDGIAVDGAHIYWGDGDAIGRSNLDGSDPQPTWITGLPQRPVGIATDAGHIYWVTTGSDVYSASLDGTDVTDLAHAPGATITALTVVDGTIYFVSDNSVYSVSAGGGTPNLVLTAQAIDGATPPLLNGIAYADGYLYVSELSLPTGEGAAAFGSIGKAPLNNPGAVNETFINGLTEVAALASDGTYLYWAESVDSYQATDIGRIPLSDPNDVQNTFITEPASVTALAADTGIDPTTTTVTCGPTAVAIGQPSSCTATVTDAASPSTPTGTINFTGNGAAFFLGSPCQLTARTGGGAGCTVGADLTSVGSQSITATYSGDTAHQASSGTAALCAGTTAQCGGSPPPAPPPPPKPSCVVPKLKGKTLAGARAALRRAHCVLGKITEPKRKRGRKQPRLVVGSTKPGAATKLSSGAKIAVTLLPKPAAHKRRRR